MEPRRVVITGIGVVSAIGSGRERFAESLREGRSGIRPLTSVDTSGLRAKRGAEVDDVDPSAVMTRSELRYMDRFACFALLAAREAVEDAGIDWTDALRSRTVVATGSGIGGQGTIEDAVRARFEKKSQRLSPLIIPRAMTNAAASCISMEFGLTGPVFTLATACSSSNHAIGQAFHMVRSGAADLALAGGSETPLTDLNLRAWDAMRGVVSPDTCRPFSRDRSGMILGEGGAMLVLEPRASAARRGAAVYAELRGFGMSSDASHLTNPSPAGAARAMRAALDDARMPAGAVGYVNAHGTGTTLNDRSETLAIRETFGEHAGRLAVSSTKSMHGHALGAAGALEAAATALALRDAVLPPTANFNEPDPECDLDVIPNVARERQAGHALSNSFAFGGLNAVLALSAAQEA